MLRQLINIDHFNLNKIGKKNFPNCFRDFGAQFTTSHNCFVGYCIFKLQSINNSKSFVKTKRLNDDVSQHQDAGASGDPRQFVNGMFEPNWRGGQTCEGGKAEQGVGGGEGVPPDDIYIYERPQSLQEKFDRFKYGTSDNKTLNVEMDSLAPDFSVQELGVDGGKLKVRVAGS